MICSSDIVRPEQTITSPFPLSGERMKGGEKRMASEWEELEKLSKEELIIELVRERTAHRELDRALRGLIEVDYPADRKLPIFNDECVDSIDDQWISSIANYAADRDGVDGFTPYSLESYGLSEDDSRKGYAMLRLKGRIIDDRYDEEDLP